MNVYIGCDTTVSLGCGSARDYFVFSSIVNKMYKARTWKSFPYIRMIIPWETKTCLETPTSRPCSVL